MSRSGVASPLNSIDSLRLALRQFAAERDWDQFHSPKNLAIALSVEASELLEHFQWMAESDSNQLPPEKLIQVRDEMADVLIYLVRIADRLGVDLLEASSKKLEVNARKYPVERARGTAKKYTDI